MTGGGAVLNPRTDERADITENFPTLFPGAPLTWNATAAWDGPPPQLPQTRAAPQVQAYAICAP